MNEKYEMKMINSCCQKYINNKNELAEIYAANVVTLKQY